MDTSVSYDEVCTDEFAAALAWEAADNASRSASGYNGGIRVPSRDRRIPYRIKTIEISR